MNRRVDELEIEFLRPNEAAFGSAGAGGFVDIEDELAADAFDEEPRPRWTMAVAGLLVTGLLAGGIIAAAPWSSDATATPPTSTTTPPTSTTVTAPRTTVPRDPLEGVPTEPAGWVIGTGRFWQFGGAGSNGVADVTSGVMSGQRLDVWADRDTTRDDGPWLTVLSRPYADGRLVTGGVRTLFGDRPGVVSTDDAGVTHISVVLGTRGSTLTIESKGLGLDQLAELAAAVEAPERFDDDRIVYGPLRSRSGVFDLPLRSSTPAGFGGIPNFGIPLASTYWYQDSGSSINVDLWEVDEEALAVLPLLMEPVEIPPQLTPMKDELTEIGRDVSVYSSPDQPGSLIVMWRMVDRMVTLTGYGNTATMAQLLTAARSARPADEIEWRDLILQGQQGVSFTTTQPDVTMLQTGEFADGRNWDATLSDQGWFWMNGADNGWYGTIGAADGAAGVGDTAVIERFIAADVTIWAAVDPTGAAVTMRVTAPGEAPIDIPMETLGTATAALHPRLVDVAATIELLDAAGTVVASTP